jgi:CCT motif
MKVSRYLDISLITSLSYDFFIQSISGRLRSASDLEDKGLITRNEKGILKDLIISGDEALQEALEKYEKGDKSQLETMIKSGLLSRRLPPDLDLLGDLDLDFLTVDDVTVGSLGQHNIEANQDSICNRGKGDVVTFNSSGNSIGEGSHVDDGISEFEFGNDMGGDSDSYLRFNSRSNSIDLDNFRFRSGSFRSESIDGRDRSNSLALFGFRSRSNSLAFPDARDRSNSLAMNGIQPDSYASDGATSTSLSQQRWMDSDVGEMIDLSRSPNPPIAVSGIGASLAEYNSRMNQKQDKSQIAEEKRRERQLKKEQKDMEKQNLKERKELERKDKKESKHKDKREKKGKKLQKSRIKEEDSELGEERVIESGSGRPRSMSDPNLRTSIDSNGLLEVERPDGWVGAYSPDSRRVRIERFLEKRHHRVWTKSVKYDVRKNFADSRLRVKGRFVKKEDELLMRELMSLT